MTRKSILNLTSRKKRDTMLNWSNTSASGAAIGANVQAYTTNGSRVGWVVFCATARDLNNNAGGANILIDEPDRTATTCYMRGMSENLKYETNTGVPWLHRRICFTVRPQTPFHDVTTGDTPTISTFNRAETSLGWTRAWIDLSLNAMPETMRFQRALLFKGDQDKDWTDIMTAKVDTRRVDLKSDTTYRISSGNATGVFRERKRWYPMNKNLVYADDESGDAMQSNVYSVQDKRGMGDYFVVDIFQAGTAATKDDVLKITSSTSLYWHEK